MDRVLVGTLERSLFDRSSGGEGFLSVDGEAVGAFGGERVAVGEVEDADLAYDGAAFRRRDGDAAVRLDANGSSRNDDRLLLCIEDRFTGSGLKYAGRGSREGPVARVAGAVRRLNSEKPVALDGEIEWVAG